MARSRQTAAVVWIVVAGSLLVAEHLTLPRIGALSLLQGWVPAFQNGGRSYFATGRNSAPVFQVPSNSYMSKVMQDTVRQRQRRYAEHGYGWHDPTIAQDVKAAISPLEHEVAQMQGEVESEQGEIENLQHHQAASPAPVPAQGLAPVLRFSIPGPISIDHLRLPTGDWSRASCQNVHDIRSIDLFIILY